MSRILIIVLSFIVFPAFAAAAESVTFKAIGYDYTAGNWWNSGEGRKAAMLGEVGTIEAAFFRPPESSIIDIDAVLLASTIRDLKKTFCDAIGTGSVKIYLSMDVKVGVVLSSSVGSGIEVTFDC